MNHQVFNLLWQRRFPDELVRHLLERDPVKIDNATARASLAGQRVMITGAGGCIGSELARQLAALAPQQLILLERAENVLHNIEIELQADFPDVEIISLLTDVTDGRDVAECFARVEPQTIFHAAAYKQVPMMERHALQAVRGNLLGTANVAQASIRCGAENFIMISTDKAVNPVSVMGATKRAAELMTAALQQSAGATRLVSVRFGNVLGSSGSVIELWLRQMAMQRPLTVTHPQAQRFFMTTSEAVQLVLQAAAMKTPGGEIFVLEMGKAVMITDLAKRLIRLTGLQSEVDAEIQFIGLRPGEKLIEEIQSGHEKALATEHEKICLLKSPAMPMERIHQWLEDLRQVVENRNENTALKLLREIVPEYSPSQERQKS
jgi:FlaA1/EpsC-like NDP-sugar epimerase